METGNGILSIYHDCRELNVKVASDTPWEQRTKGAQPVEKVINRSNKGIIDHSCSQPVKPGDLRSLLESTGVKR